MASSTIFQNMIKQVIRYNKTFTPLGGGFKFQVEGSNNTWYPSISDQTVIPCNINLVLVDSNTDALLRFSYVWNAETNSTRYYLPVGSGDEIDKIRIYTKYYNSDDSLGYGSNTYIQIHEADIDGQVSYDENDFISTITVDVRVTSGVPPLNLNVTKKLAGESAQKVKPHYVKFFTETETPDIGDSNGYNTNEAGVTTSDQIGNDAGFPTPLSIEFFGDDVQTLEMTTHHEPTKYKLYSEDHILLDSGNINEAVETENIDWKSGDSIKFTYTNSELNKIS